MAADDQRDHHRNSGERTVSIMIECSPARDAIGVRIGAGSAAP